MAATSGFILLLPPSEGKAAGGNRTSAWKPESGAFGQQLGGWRRDVAVALKQLGGGDEKLLGVKGVHLDAARRANSSLIGAPTLPAWQRYTGVVWDHLDLASLSAAACAAVAPRIVVVSALMGLVAGDDPTPEYRLKMGARLGDFGTMATWWRDDLTAPLLAYAKGRPIVDLLPQEHRAAIDTDALDVIRIDLVAKSGGRVGGHNAKAAKGLLARHLLTTRGGNISHMVASFDHLEYRARLT